jgi:hypothetical protein
VDLNGDIGIVPDRPIARVNLSTTFTRIDRRFALKKVRDLTVVVHTTVPSFGGAHSINSAGFIGIVLESLA